MIVKLKNATTLGKKETYSGLFSLLLLGAFLLIKGERFLIYLYSQKSFHQQNPATLVVAFCTLLNGLRHHRKNETYQFNNRRGVLPQSSGEIPYNLTLQQMGSEDFPTVGMEVGTRRKNS